MKATIISLLAGLAIVGIGCGSSTTSGGGKPGESGAPLTNADKIVGIWKMSKKGGQAVALSVEIEYTKDGKMQFAGGPAIATYKVEGDTVTVTPNGDKPAIEKHTIKKLDATTLVLYDVTNKEDVEYTKKK